MATPDFAAAAENLHANMPFYGPVLAEAVALAEDGRAWTEANGNVVVQQPGGRQFRVTPQFRCSCSPRRGAICVHRATAHLLRDQAAPAGGGCP